MNPTEKQLESIQAIEDCLNIRFEGETIDEASMFISNNSEEFQNTRQDTQDEYEYWNE